MYNPLVSIITPCYNGEKYLDRYFNSILYQTYAPLELIFVNDGSTDRTAEIAESYRDALERKGVRYIYLYQENAGQAAALNRGLKLFTGSYLTWPDADDEMTPDCIEKKVAYLETHPELDMCICKVMQIFEEDSKTEIGLLERKQTQPDNFFEDLIFLRNVFYVPGGYMVRRDAVDRLIPDRQIYTGRGGQNAQILLPFAWQGNYGYIDAVLYKYFVRKDSHSHSVDTSEKAICQQEQFQAILLETLKKMPEEVYAKYAPMVRRKYSRMRFGNALDTENPRLIAQYYKDLVRAGDAKLMDWLRFVKHTVPILRNL